MLSKSTVQVRIKVQGSRQSVRGYSSYSNQSFNTKYNNAILNAIYQDRANKRIPFKSGDAIPKYEVLSTTTGFIGKEDKKISRKQTKQLDKQILARNQKQIDEDTPISSKKAKKDIGYKTEDKKMQSIQEKLRRKELQLEEDRKEVQRLKKAIQREKHKGRKQ